MVCFFTRFIHGKSFINRVLGVIKAALNKRCGASRKIAMLNRFCIFILKIYKKYVSKGLNSGCIFTPTCSIYTIEALEKYGFIKAFTLILFRILRCNSINKALGGGGFDPPDDPRVKRWLY